MAVEFKQNNIEVDGKPYRAYYSTGPYTAKSRIPQGTITIYAYKCRFPQNLGLTEDTYIGDTSNYCELEIIRITPNNTRYAEVKAVTPSWMIRG